MMTAFWLLGGTLHELLELIVSIAPACYLLVLQRFTGSCTVPRPLSSLFPKRGIETSSAYQKQLAQKRNIPFKHLIA